MASFCKSETHDWSLPAISPKISDKNTLFKSAKMINLATSFVSPIFKVASKIVIQHNISPFIYLHVKHKANSLPG